MNPADGDHLTLTCTSKDPHVHLYQFIRNGKPLGQPLAKNTLDASHVSLSNTGTFACKAFIGSLATDPSSDTSTPVTITGDILPSFLLCLSYLVYFTQ